MTGATRTPAEAVSLARMSLARMSLARISPQHDPNATPPPAGVRCGSAFATAALLALALVSWPTSARAGDTEFMRFVDRGSAGGALETAVARYVDDAGIEITLFAAVHIADPGYYAELQKRFRPLDALLYELIAPRGTRPAPGHGSSSLLSFFQRLLRRVLSLEFQLDAIDYTPANFVHADMSPASFSRAQRERGESLLTILFRFYVEAVKRELGGHGSQMTPAALLDAIGSPDASRQLKLLLAREMTDVELLLSGLGGEDGESVILTDRNRVALRVLDEQIDAGRRKLGIFYGGAHMPDMEERLLARGFRRTGLEYLTAWDCVDRKKGEAAASRPASQPASPATSRSRPRRERF